MESETKAVKPKTQNVKIKSMNGKFASGGVNVAAGRKAKIGPDDICKVDAKTAESFADCDTLELTTKKHTCELVNGVVVRG